MATEPTGPVRLSRKQRIKSGRDFLRVKTEGKRLVTGCLIANWLPQPAGALTRLAVITGRRLGGAVARNRARRLLREAFRLHQGELSEPVDLVLIARPSIKGKKLCAVEEDLLAAWRRGGLLKQ